MSELGSRPGRGDLGPDAAPQGCPRIATFLELAQKHSVVPVWRELVADSLTPVGAFRAMVGDGPGFLLESVEGGERWSRFSFLGRSPAATFVARGQKVVVTDGTLPESVPLDKGVLACLESLLQCFKSPSLEELPPLHGGLVGYLGYDVVREIERLDSPPPDDIGHPDAVVSVIGELAAFDHWRQRVSLVNNVLLDPTRSADERPRRAGGFLQTGALATRGHARRPRKTVSRPAVGAAFVRGNLARPTGSPGHERGQLPPRRRSGQGVHPGR